MSRASLRTTSRLLTSVLDLTAVRSRSAIHRMLLHASSSTYASGSSSSSSSANAKPEFSCVDANERRGQKLQGLAEQARNASASSSSSLCSTPSSTDPSVAFLASMPTKHARPVFVPNLPLRSSRPRTPPRQLVPHPKPRSMNLVLNLPTPSRFWLPALPPCTSVQVRLWRRATAIRPCLRDVGHTQQRQEQCHSPAHRIVRFLARSQHRIQPGQRMVARLYRTQQTPRHEPLLRHLHQRPRWLLRLYGPLFSASFGRKWSSLRYPFPHLERLRHGPSPILAPRSSGYRQTLR